MVTTMTSASTSANSRFFMIILLFFFGATAHRAGKKRLEPSRGISIVILGAEYDTPAIAKPADRLEPFSLFRLTGPPA